MLKNILVSFRNRNLNVDNLDIPNYCPHCGETIQPNVIYAASHFQTTDEPKNIGVFLQCTSQKCLNYFSLLFESDYSSELPYRLISYTYRPPIKVELPTNIKYVSEKFVDIYSQATVAENENLDQIAGVGYRKSLEFLIKDYAIRNNPDKENAIKSQLLGTVISDFLTDFPKLQNLARAATWIGNDETHYVRRHTDRDIRDMKAFIQSASQFIAADYDADVAEEFINE